MSLSYEREKVVFCDTETTGLYPDLGHEVWEIAAIYWESDQWNEHVWRVQPDLSKADPIALQINKFYKRTPRKWSEWNYAPDTAPVIARIFDGRHIIGAIPSFDVMFLDRFLRKNGQCLTVHYHVIDVEAMSLGFLAAMEGTLMLPLPWKSDWLKGHLGIETIDEKDHHTALGDAKKAKEVWDRICGPIANS